MNVRWISGASRRSFSKLMILVVALVSVRAFAAPQDQSAKSTFDAKCASCHGKNGAGTPVGKSLQAPHLGSPQVESQSEAQLRQIISEGKGNMPPFKGSLSDAQIDSLVAYIRTFSKQQK
jgi:mono/diheme cytochrome c family protein